VVILNFQKNHIIVLLIILFLATSWPDIITFYRDELFTKDNKMLGKFETFKVLITELLYINNYIYSIIFYLSVSFIIYLIRSFLIKIIK
jgi:hypothetical protein